MSLADIGGQPSASAVSSLRLRIITRGHRRVLADWHGGGPSLFLRRGRRR